MEKYLRELDEILATVKAMDAEMQAMIRENERILRPSRGADWEPTRPMTRVEQPLKDFK